MYTCIFVFYFLRIDLFMNTCIRIDINVYVCVIVKK